MLYKSVWNDLHIEYMKFNMHQSIDETEYFLDSFIIHKSLKLVDNVSNQIYHQIT